MFVTSVVQFWSEWGLRISVLGSLAAYALLGLLSGTRRSAFARRPILRWVVVLVLWVAYQGAELSATSALGSLSLCGSDASVEEQQLIVFWAPFLLVHLGGPDNMTAYTLEDNMLSLRKMLEMILQFLGAIYAIWNYIYRGHSWVLFAASAIMFVAGAARYVERACALWRANLDNMQEQDSSKEEETAGSSGGSTSTEVAMVALGSTISRSLAWELGDDEALLLAQDLFPIWRRAMLDSSVDPGSASQRTSEKILSLRWRSMCKVVEMELSLMYEVLYTKATVAHTWPGYLIRFVSPLATATAASLFWLYRDSKHGRRIRGSIVLITYLLLGAAFAMDVVWLLRALGSTWTYAFLKKKARRQPWAWFHHQVLCAGRWRRLYRAVVYLDPLRLLFAVNPVSYRKWSGTIGRYNLLRECTSTSRLHPWCGWLVTKLGLEETSYLSELPQSVKEVLFERVRRILPTADNPPRRDGAYNMVAITTYWGQEALRRGEKLFIGVDGSPRCGREFEQDVLAWHIATCIFLSRTMVRELPKPSMTWHVPAIEAMSEYLMFLVAKRRQMLPGLVLHSLLEETHKVLEDIWKKEGGNEKLATLVRRKRNSDPGWVKKSDGRRLVWDAAVIAGALTNSSKGQRQVVQMLDLIFNVWVDKLLYAGIRCSRESHAKQLSRGGELTTVLWMVVQHAGPFRIGQEMPEEEKMRPVKKPVEKKPEPAPMEPPRVYMGYPPDLGSWPQPQYYPEPSAAGKPEMAKPSEKEEPEDAQVPEDEVDPEDAKDYRTPIEYITLY